MWRYYLLSSAGAFRARSNQLWQIVLSRDGVPGGYVSVPMRPVRFPHGVSCSLACVEACLLFEVG